MFLEILIGAQMATGVQEGRLIMEIITLSTICAVLLAGSGAAVYHYEKAIRILKYALCICYADIKSLRNSVDKLRRISDYYECEGKLAAQQCAELRDLRVRQSRDSTFAACREGAHPGELLKDLYFKNATILGIARQFGVARSVIHRILAGKQAITADTAYKLEKAYGVSALMLLNMQAKYDLQAITAKHKCAKQGGQQKQFIIE